MPKIPLPRPRPPQAPMRPPEGSDMDERIKLLRLLTDERGPVAYPAAHDNQWSELDPKAWTQYAGFRQSPNVEVGPERTGLSRAISAGTDDPFYHDDITRYLRDFGHANIIKNVVANEAPNNEVRRGVISPEDAMMLAQRFPVTPMAADLGMHAINQMIAAPPTLDVAQARKLSSDAQAMDYYHRLKQLPDSKAAALQEERGSDPASKFMAEALVQHMEDRARDKEDPDLEEDGQAAQRVE